jgi:hypothetical protein
LHATIWESIENFKQRFGTEAMPIRARVLPMDCLWQRKTSLPEIAAKGLEGTERFHPGTATDEERAPTRKACRDYRMGKKDGEWGFP